MAAELIKPGVTYFNETCSECAALFRYTKDDLHTNFAYGHKVVFCPGCNNPCRHYGARRALANGCET